MTINEVFEQSIKAIKGQPMYAGQFYSPEGVIAIIKDIQSKVVGNNVIGVVSDNEHTLPTITQDMLEALEERIADNINDISESDIVDADSLEATISNGRVTIDNLDVDKGPICDEAIYGIEDTVREWLYDHKIFIKD